MSMVDFPHVNFMPAQVTPDLAIHDPVASYWFQQVSLRLRREVAWCWHQRGPIHDPNNGTLPPITDAAVENLDLIRFENQKRQFFATDPAGQYLSEQIAQLHLITDFSNCWNRVAGNLELDPASQFVMAMAFAA